MKQRFSQFAQSFAALVAKTSRDTTLELAGLGVVSYGVGMIFLPAGLIVAGLALCFVGYALSSDTG